jgi:hypothetical protein
MFARILQSGMSDDKIPKPLLSFSPDSAEILSNFQREILREAARRCDESTEALTRGVQDARRQARESGIHAHVAGSRAVLAVEELAARVEALERAVRHLQRPSGFSGLFKR